jgi:hypothetical protein
MDTCKGQQLEQNSKLGVFIISNLRSSNHSCTPKFTLSREDDQKCLMAGRVAQISNGRAPTQQDGDPKFNNQYRKKKKRKD